MAMEDQDRKEGCLALADAWRLLRLSVRCPSRLPTWDAILVTAASPEQAELYEMQLERAKRRGRIAAQTAVLAVPDPQGRRIGSGGATFGALRQLALHLKLEDEHLLAEKRVLLVHAGGDSKRVPWANAIGKAFVPFPLLVSTQQDFPDEPVPVLFDHILAVASLAVSQLADRGGLFIMTGDVLPCFDASKIILPENGNGAVVVTVPISLKVAANHGVILSQSPPYQLSAPACLLVQDLLQKPSIEEMHRRGAVGSNSTALLDTGIFLVIGEAWQRLIQLSLSKVDPVQQLVEATEEMSLYEDIAGAWVSARHDWLNTRPLGPLLIEGLGANQLYHYCAYDLAFLHFGTSSEILQHVARDYLSARIGRRQFSYVENDATVSLAPSSVVLASEISGSLAIGDRSLIFNCSLAGRLKEVGSNCIIIGVRDIGAWSDLSLPDNHCLWDVPVKNGGGRIILCCGIHDNPKLSAEEGGTFCGKAWDEVLGFLRVNTKEIWSIKDGSMEAQDLWHARLFPIVPAEEGLEFAAWLTGATKFNDGTLHARWRGAQRVSLAELQKYADFKLMYTEMSNHQARLAARFAMASIEDGFMDRNFNMLTNEIICGDESAIAACCKQLLSIVPDPEVVVPASRSYQVRADLSRLSGDSTLVIIHEASALQAVVTETAAAVQDTPTQRLLGLHPGRASTVKLPVRIDIVGGWSDTPPWSLERKGCVLNMAVCLNGEVPVGADVLVRKIPGVCIRDDMGNRCSMEDVANVKAPFDEDDPFRLVKAALVVTGWTKPGKVRFPWGLEIRTWAAVPRGSGLGTSSILAAAVVRALLEVSDGNICDDNVARLVLVLEQLMGTGGGWQDQVGGIYPGLKCTTSLPRQPLEFIIKQVPLSHAVQDELENRMLLIFTGQVRLAHTVLQKVVTRYLQRDGRLIMSIERLAQLAELGQEAFVNNDLDLIGRIMEEAWQIHQELDPYCSNVLVDSIFRRIRHLCCGCKLVGAGGGGFAIVMARNGEAARNIERVISSSFGNSVEFYRWNLFQRC